MAEGAAISDGSLPISPAEEVARGATPAREPAPEGRILRLPSARQRVARRRRLVSLAEWAALLGMGAAAALLIILAAISLMGH